MNILFLYPHPAEKRLEIYREAALTLRDRFGHRVVFVHIGVKQRFDDNLTTEHFDGWVDSNRKFIETSSLLQLEKEFPRSNLWRSIIAQRTVTDYSYIGDSSPLQHRSLEEIEFWLKAVVLFYRHVLEKHSINLAVAHAPDCIHSLALYELARSRSFRAINQYYDPYWQQGRYVTDEVSYSSTVLNQCYRENLKDYERRVLPKEPELEQLLARCQAVDPRSVLVRQAWPTTLFTMFIASWKGVTSGWSRFRIGPVNILEGYYHPPLWPSVKAWATRTCNLLARRTLIHFSEQLPSRPFVLFAPHYQPEAATLAGAPVWSDMLGLGRLLSTSLPAGYQLVVKDHPLIGGYRAPYFYRQLSRLPNVIILPENYSSLELIRRCDLVATVGGTIGLQALIFGKPTLLFGPIYYGQVTGVLRPPADLNDLPDLLKDVLINHNFPQARERKRSLLAFLAAYKTLLVVNPKFEEGKTPKERGEGLAELINGWIENGDIGTRPNGIEEQLQKHP